jgi:hypothetical protein
MSWKGVDLVDERTLIDALRKGERRMAQKEVVLICSEIGTRDYLPKDLVDKQFRDVADWLWKKYPDQIQGWLKQNLGGLETPNRDRAPLRFDYVDPAGTNIVIDPAENVVNISQVTEQVQWHPQVVGGANFRQAFGTHASDILARPNYRNWRCLAQGQPGYGIRAVGPDPQGVIRTWTITPTANYPESPPAVISEPSYTNDICWRDGVLHYTSGRGVSPWQELARRSNNPLLALMIELLQKYKLGV